MLDLKQVNYKNKYKHDLICRICRVKDETLEHIFQCKAYEKELNLKNDFSTCSDDVEKISKPVEIIENILDVREKHIEKEEKKRNLER